jgi:hypothetical protein
VGLGMEGAMQNNLIKLHAEVRAAGDAATKEQLFKLAEAWVRVPTTNPKAAERLVKQLEAKGGLKPEDLTRIATLKSTIAAQMKVVSFKKK